MAAPAFSSTLFVKISRIKGWEYCRTTAGRVELPAVDNSIEDAAADFAGTTVYDDAIAVFRYYRSIEDDFSEFERTFGIACPEICGRCCEHFIPDVTYLEALAVAFYLIEIEHRDVAYLAGWHNDHDGCPLLDAKSKRCIAYKARPIICRVFCSAASKTKKGLAFHGCHLSSDPGSMVGCIDERKLKAAGIYIPVMSDYGEKIRQLQKENAKTMLLDDAVQDVASKLTLIRSFLGNDDDDDFTPQAS